MPREFVAANWPVLVDLASHSTTTPLAHIRPNLRSPVHANATSAMIKFGYGTEEPESDHTHA